MIKIALFGVLALACLASTQATPLAPQPARDLEAAHCTFWTCSTTGDELPTLAVCRAECPGGTCSPIDICP